MEWTADVSAGDWLHERIDDGDAWGQSMHGVVPHGFAAYARVLHPASVEELPGGERLPTSRQWQAMTWEQHEPLMERMIYRPATWAEAAAAFGTTLHPGAQWHRIVGIGGDPHPSDWQQVDSPDGRWFNAPTEGELAADLVTTLAGILTAHTTTPDAGHVALWEGGGALLGFLGDAPSRTFLQFGDPGDATLAHHNEMLSRSVKDPFNNVFRAPSWQEGILSREISEGPRLELPGRGHVLFRGGVAELAAPDWVLQVPWRDRIAEAHGFDPCAQSPNIVWPEDRSWVWVTEVDYDSTIVGGSPELVAALVADPRLEDFEISEGTSLTYDSDEVNR